MRMYWRKVGMVIATRSTNGARMDQLLSCGFAGAYKKVVEKRAATPALTLRIHRDAKHVTIVQSPDPAFVDLWEAAHPAGKTN